jgi:hypothetical protein
MQCSLKDTSVAEQSICLIRLFCMGLRVQTPLATTTSQYCAAFSRITKDMRCHQPQDDRVSLSLATWSRLYSCRRNQWQHNISCAAARGEGWNKTIQSGWPVGKLKAPLPLLPACRYYCPTAPLAGRAINIHFLPLPSRVVSQRSNSRPMRRCPTGRLLLSSASTIVHPWKR